jgi:hypothetical protein
MAVELIDQLEHDARDLANTLDLTLPPQPPNFLRRVK